MNRFFLSPHHAGGTRVQLIPGGLLPCMPNVMRSDAQLHGRCQGPGVPVGGAGSRRSCGPWLPPGTVRRPERAQLEGRRSRLSPLKPAAKVIEAVVAAAQVDPEGAGASTRGEAVERSKGRLDALTPSVQRNPPVGMQRNTWRG